MFMINYNTLVESSLFGRKKVTTSRKNFEPSYGQV